MTPNREAQSVLASVSAGHRDTLKETFRLADLTPRPGVLDERESALVRIAALIALDAPPASYAYQVASAAEAGVGADEILGVLRAVGSQVGMPRVIAAAPEIMLALGMALSPEGN